MQEVLIYFLQSSLVLAGLYVAYWLLLRKETFYQLNRILLLGILGLSLLIPFNPIDYEKLFPVPFSESMVEEIPLDDVTHEAGPMKAIALSTETHSQFDLSVSSFQSFFLHLSDYLSYLSFIYVACLLFFLLKICHQLFILFRFFRLGRIQYEGKDKMLYTGEKVPPFSFFRMIILNPDLHKTTQLDQIISHERVHANQLHSIDILLVEIFTAIFWFNPFSWLIRRMIKLNLEYLADAHAIRSGVDRKAYQYTLLSLSLPEGNTYVANQFNFSPIKKRILMMNSPQSPVQNRWKYLLFLPLLFAISMFIQPLQAQISKEDKLALQKAELEIAVAQKALQKALIAKKAALANMAELERRSGKSDRFKADREVELDRKMEENVAFEEELALQKEREEVKKLKLELQLAQLKAIDRAEESEVQEDREKALNKDWELERKKETERIIALERELAQLREMEQEREVDQHQQMILKNQLAYQEQLAINQKQQVAELKELEQELAAQSREMEKLKRSKIEKNKEKGELFELERRQAEEERARAIENERQYMEKIKAEKELMRNQEKELNKQAARELSKLQALKRKYELEKRSKDKKGPIDLSENDNLYVVIRPDISPKILQGVEAELRNRGIYVRYTEVNFNHKEKLTHFGMSVQIPKKYEGSISTGNSRFDSPIVFYILQRNGKEYIGLSEGYPKELPRADRKTMERMTGLLITDGKNSTLSGRLDSADF